MLGKVFNFLNNLRPDICIDIDSGSLTIYRPNKNQLISEPLLVALDKGTEKALAFGDEAVKLFKTNPARICIKNPLDEGLLINEKMFEQLFSHLLKKVIALKGINKPSLAIGIPAFLSSAEMQAVRGIAEKYSHQEVLFIRETIAGAIGAELPIEEDVGNMICHIGAATAEIAVISSGDIVVSCNLHTGIKAFIAAMIEYIKKNHHYKIDTNTAHYLLKNYADFSYTGPRRTVRIKMKKPSALGPERLILDSAEITRALEPPVKSLIDAIKKTLQQIPGELAANIVENRIVLTGEGPLPGGLAAKIAQALDIQVEAPEHPQLAVVLGLSKIMEVSRNMARNSYL